MAKVILIFLVSLNSYSFYHGKENLPRCNDLGINFHNNIIIYNYKENELIGTEKSLILMETEWSNLMEDIEEIFISDNANLDIDSIQIEYFAKFQKKHEYSLKKNLSKNEKFSKIENFVFLNGVLPKAKRPGRQYYIPLSKNKEICYFSIDHYFADEQN